MLEQAPDHGILDVTPFHRVKRMGGEQMAEESRTVRSVERALDILLCFADGGGLSMSEVSQRVGLHKSTVHRLLASLEKKGFVVRDPATEKYRLGFKVWELAANVWESDDPAVVLLPEMERLRDSIGETVSLYVRDGHERIRIQAVQSIQSVRRVATIGARLPLYVGASGKILTAYADDKVREQILNSDDWPDRMRRESYERQLDEIAKSGFATSIEEREPGAAAVAAPIFNRSRELVAALSISGPVSRFTPDKLKRYAEEVKEAANRMGKMIG